MSDIRIEAAKAIAEGFCRAHYFPDVFDGGKRCICSEPGVTCNAATLYSHEAASAMAMLDRAGFRFEEGENELRE